LRSLRTDAQNVFCRWIEADNQQAAVEQDDAEAQAIEYAFVVIVEAAVVGAFARPAA
jgi:hypothetical protein